METSNTRLTYGALAAIGTIILALGLWLSGWELSGWLSNQAVYVASVFSQFVVRVIAGFGLIATYIVVCEAILGHLSRTLRGRKVRSRRLITFLILVPCALLIYSVLRVVNASFYNYLTIFDVVYLLAGIWGLILIVYLVPISRREFGSFAESPTEFKDIEGKLTKVRRKIKKLYYEKIRKEYAEAYGIEFLRMRERLYIHRQRIAAFLFLPFALGSLVLPPIALMFMFLWVKASLFKRDVGYTLLDRSILVITILAAGIYGSIQIFTSLGSLQFALSIAQLIGTVVGYVAFLYIARRIL